MNEYLIQNLFVFFVAQIMCACNVHLYMCGKNSDAESRASIFFRNEVIEQRAWQEIDF